MDTSVKIWNLDNILLVDLIERSYTEAGKDSPGQMFQMPEFSTKNVHNNYIDFVAWVGNALLTNAVCDKVALWMPDNSLYQVTVH
jgi:polycomb protein EED